MEPKFLPYDPGFRTKTMPHKTVRAAEAQKGTPAARSCPVVTRCYRFTFTSAVRMAVEPCNTACSFNPPPANKS